jgi:pimeloyl-ACP methyl ester carboxylesterase
MTDQAVALYYREYGAAELPPLVLLHGLFGASNNWLGVVQRLQADYRLILPDLRNHGRSPPHPVMDYPAMAEDLLALLDRLRLDSVNLLGHSMGGKAAMWLALSRPEGWRDCWWPTSHRSAIRCASIRFSAGWRRCPWSG